MVQPLSLRGLVDETREETGGWKLEKAQQLVAGRKLSALVMLQARLKISAREEKGLRENLEGMGLIDENGKWETKRTGVRELDGKGNYGDCT